MRELVSLHFGTTDGNNLDKQDSAKAFNSPLEGVGEQVWSMEAKYLHFQDLLITQEKPNLSTSRSYSNTLSMMEASLSDQCHA